ncbi:glycosyltransferase [Tropicibacter naphthalenivorans]|uniref:GDP-mannose-dependent alpha-(1-6)-phosphatidylinositol monomannoside mannosyltransferase n=1 Tax=Tropicibacter naphthalenivorans TaxID=441103 RepID=A0A0P1G069_9RHOB|nr:glycosyltransferase [Tropicibacter naphthalenivorans]CUH74964.1 GDP-mannose-dependent alpha-(1-6)-phosphatidylinositol monomannoside mannosyltransferase [Tropicibacter naphthalenivorans]SMC47770.1 Glycosyltransferase involved in cell wall bisynthesis [Tropicibacter naphthalenivorans]
MRIVIIVSDFPKVTETFVLANALHYLDAGHDARIFHLKPFRTGEVIHGHAQRAIERGFTFGWLSFGGLMWALGRPRRLGRVVAQIVRGFAKEPKRLAASLAIVPKSCALARACARDGTGHIHAEFAGYPATSAWIAATLSGVPFSFSAHAHDIFLTQSLLAEKAQDARFVRVISRFNRDFLAALPSFPADRLEVLRCGVSLPEPTPTPSPATPWRLLFVGALLPRKGVEDLLEALSRLADLPIHLDVVGGGRLREGLEAMAQQMGLDVTFHGAQPSDAVRARMRDAHLVVVPSKQGDGGRSEGIPVVLMEAMSEARPVVASRLSGIPELVEDGVTGRLSGPGDPAALAGAIRAALTDWQGTLEMAQRGRARVAEHYDIQKNAAALLARIEEEAA